MKRKGNVPAGVTLRDAFSGKEDQQPDFGAPWLDFGARAYSPALRRWMVPDPLGEKYYGVNPYAYCNGDPVNLVDLLGKEITGATRKDAERVVEDLRSLFIGEDLEKLRNLITQSGKKKNGKSLSKISTESLSLALSGVSLSDDQKALRNSNRKSNIASIRNQLHQYRSQSWP